MIRLGKKGRRQQKANNKDIRFHKSNNSCKDTPDHPDNGRFVTKDKIKVTNTTDSIR